MNKDCQPSERNWKRRRGEELIGHLANRPGRASKFLRTVLIDLLGTVFGLWWSEDRKAGKITNRRPQAAALAWRSRRLPRLRVGLQRRWGVVLPFGASALCDRWGRFPGSLCPPGWPRARG